MRNARIALYWEGGRPPAYLTLCVSTWLNFFNLDEIQVLNQSNVEAYVGDTLRLQRLRSLSLAKQSDVVSAAYLAKYGGCFLDADTILTNNCCRDFIEPNCNGSLRQFHYHIGALAVKAGHTGLVHWAEKAALEMESQQLDKPWNNVGNAIIDPFMGLDENAGLVERWSVWEKHATPERIASYWAEFDEGKSPSWYYRNFWFNKSSAASDLIVNLQASPSGIVCLHNSWTPAWYRTMSLESLLEDNSPLSIALTSFATLDKIQEVEDLLTYGS